LKWAFAVDASKPMAVAIPICSNSLFFTMYLLAKFICR
jgi:hypothetical protein